MNELLTAVKLYLVTYDLAERYSPFSVFGGVTLADNCVGSCAARRRLEAELEREKVLQACSSARYQLNRMIAATEGKK